MIRFAPSLVLTLSLAVASSATAASSLSVGYLSDNNTSNSVIQERADLSLIHI